MQKSLLQDFKNYLKLNNYKKFVIYSDYCLNEDYKPNKIASFTVTPAWTTSPEIINKIQTANPLDIKDCSIVTDEKLGIVVSYFYVAATPVEV